MSTDPGFAAVPSGPPWSVDVLADLQAGVFSEEVTAQLRARIADDPEAVAIMAALDSTVDDLSLLPAPRMPERFALRLDAAIAAESAARASARSTGPRSPAGPPPAAGPPPPLAPPFRPGPSAAPFHPVTGTTPPQQYSRVGPPGPSDVVLLDAARAKRRRWVAGIGVAAAVIAAATITVASLNRTTGGSSTAGPQPGATSATASASPNALELKPGQFQDAYNQINGSRSGPLANPITYAGCMAANGIAQTDVLGVKQVTYQGQEASAIAMKLDATHAKILVVSLKCGVDGGSDVLASARVDR
ncbi:hypothetical protein SAMN04515671_1829 [Nakamurella panacisegetis]|uniref:Uncharacterized protein n=1 Tax=Nakamurella panacisegetis TaxID=1090615 RepID=A0A1H0LWM2_9ACTN|nr:hypothetical protein [Nakamurella panacisegetis]SDO72366.1 hypothetical protein SAMN04515671_1829 [Nakamurella panacisegetis]